MKAAKRFLSMLLTLCMLLSLLPSTVFAANSNVPFTDVKETDWFYDAVGYVYENGMMSGTGNNQFSPNVTTTRGMIVTILYRLEGSPAVSTASFDDVAAGEYYANGVSWAAANGVVSGYGNNLFGPNDPITREQMATILYRYAQYKEYETVVTGDVSSFTDGTSVSSYAVEPMNWAVGTGLLSGVGNNILNPTGNATRAEAATILMRFCEFDSTTSIETYTVTFDYNYGNKGTYKIVTVEAGNAVDKPVNPSRSGYSFAGWYADASGNKEFDFDSAIDRDIILYANWNKNISSGSSGSTTEYCTLSYELIFDEYVENSGLFQPQSVAKGTAPVEPADPTLPVGFFVGWFTTPDCESEFDFSAAMTMDTTIYAKWDIDASDQDHDGLYDSIEEIRGTNPSSSDTDGDGISDFNELIIGTDPLKADTDGNGTSDFDEDFDFDGIKNGVEFELGTNPLVADTDYDGLSDYDEEYNYRTDPLNPDTDGDGATDGWEVDNDCDPTQFSQKFDVLVTSDESYSDNVSASVETELSGSAVESLSVKPVSPVENPLLSPAIAGYLGTAYEFSADEEISSATITFEYDTSLGEIGEQFQPRIYYFNENTGLLEELENQTVVDGRVSAEVTHFSSYILLNKVMFDAVWEYEIKPPIVDEDGGTASLDIAFVLDYSLSMEENDPNQLCKRLSKEFVSKLRDGIDQAAIISFIKRATLNSGLTTDKDILNAAIDSIVYDDGYGTNSGTDGSAGLNLALRELASSKAQYQYVIFITDGEDNGYSYSYDDLIHTAINADIKIYTVGMGSAQESLLKRIAQETGAAYYHATTSIESDDLVDLSDVFKEIEDNTIDLTTDTNKDGIPDYYNDLIMKGELLLSNTSDEFTGIDFNYNVNGELSDDFDGDGLKNGQELRLKYVKDNSGETYVYLQMYSDPLKEHSDSDGIDDYQEYRNGSDPLITDFDGNSAGMLMRSDGLYYNQLVELYEEDWVFRVEQALFGAGLTDGFKRIAEKQIIEYFYDCASETNEAAVVASTANEAIIDSIDSLLSYIKYLKKALDKTSDIYGTISEADALEGIRNAANLIAEYKAVGSELYKMATYNAEWFEEGVVEAMRNLLDTEYTKLVVKTSELTSETEFLGEVMLKIDDFSERYKQFMDKNIISGLTISDTLTLAELGTDIADGIVTLSKVNAASETFMQNMDILIELRDSARYTEVSTAAQTVLNAMGQGATSYYQELALVVRDAAGKTLVDEIISTVFKENPVYTGYKIAMGILKLIGADETPKCIYSILCYSDMINATQNLCKNSLQQVYTPSGKYYFYQAKQLDGKDAMRHLLHSAQLCMLAEKKYIDMPQTDAYHEELASENIDGIEQWAENINITIIDKILSQVH